MISNALTFPAYAYSPDADRAGPDASARLLHGLVRFLVLVVFLVREHWLAIRQYRASTLPSSRHDRSDLLPGSAQQSAASIRGAFGNAVAWTCRRRGIAPGHKDWPDLSRAIVSFGSVLRGSLPANVKFVDPANVAFGGSTKGTRPRPAAVRPALAGASQHPARRNRRIAETPAAPAMALLQSQPKIANASPQTPDTGDRAPAWPVAWVPAIRALAEMFPISDQYRSADRPAAIPGH